MLSKTLILTSLIALTQAQAGGPLIVAVPSAPIECQPIAITFSGGTAPYFLSVIPGGQPGAVPLEFLPNQSNAGTYTWIVDIASGTPITIAIKDSTGLPNYTQQFNIQAGTSTECLGKSNPGGASSAGTGTGSTTAASTTGAGAGAGGVRGNSSSSSPATTATSAPSSSATTTTGSITTGVVGANASSLLSKVSSAVASASGTASSAAPSSTETTKSSASVFQVSGALALVAAIAALVV